MNRDTQPQTSTPEPGASGPQPRQHQDGRVAHSAADRGRSAGRHSGRSGLHRGRRSRWAATVGGAAALIVVAGGGYGMVRSVTDRTDENRSAADALPVPAAPNSAETPASASASTASAVPAAPSRSASPTATAPGGQPGTSPAATTPRTSTGAGGTGPDSAPKAPSALTRSGGATTARYAQHVVEMVNTERAKKGCAPVTVNAKLQAAAQGHSDDMAARDYYQHDTPEGVGPGERMTSAGYHWSTWGENIYKSPKDAQTAMDGWMKSPGHRDNILNCAFKEIGVGINLSSNGPWWTQDFSSAS
ncbi:CAP domain-containing protein [Streptomyces sp. H10-C2]|uniref:CAP domain-containing protein n=1 Tax=unclassified Streptomyces TaxID=2593676 RepID=UPI0024BA83F3|nr:MULTISPECIES: CAP domain-containing protein [unclassified Streptomyces]MDJ0343416.1 CAP domain-containing protein [Streptomyces sp. PH10-H1]MDJ0371773.1 CAP domain-containing protein [Streptomyces sp. H10-C2]